MAQQGQEALAWAQTEKLGHRDALSDEPGSDALREGVLLDEVEQPPIEVVALRPRQAGELCAVERGPAGFAENLADHSHTLTANSPTTNSAAAAKNPTSCSA